MTDRQQASAFSYLTGCFMTVLKPNGPAVTREKLIELYNNAVDYGKTQ